MADLPSNLLAGLDLGDSARSLSDQQSSNSSSLASFPLSFSSDSFMDDFVEAVNWLDENFLVFYIVNRIIIALSNHPDLRKSTKGPETYHVIGFSNKLLMEDDLLCFLLCTKPKVGLKF
jgi:hypothetical protein